MIAFPNKNRSPLLLSPPTTSAMLRRRWGLIACILSSIALFSGCAQLPPSSTNSTALSGKRLAVTMQFGDTIKSNYHYYFLINYDKTLGGTVGNQSAPGPVPVQGRLPGGGYGNGFASGYNGNTSAGFTDFVEFTGGACRLYHVVPGTNLQRFVLENPPVSFTLPNGGNNNTLQVAIDLSQLVVDNNGGALDPTETKTTALNIQWLQVNIVATDFIPVDPNTPFVKQVDSLGNNVLSQGNTYVTLPMNQIGRVFTNSDAAFLGLTSPEPASNDVYTSDGSVGEEFLDLLDNYTITVTQQSQ
jgi:hypothetical protein